MKTVEELGDELIAKIDGWADPDRKTVVGLEGYSASGKTTLLNYVAKQRPDILAVEVDDFLAEKRVRDEAQTDHLELDWHQAPWFRYEFFDALLTEYESSGKAFVSPIYNRHSKEFDAEKSFDLSKDVLLAEGAFLLVSPLARRIDRLVYLATPKEVADKRRWDRHAEKEVTPSRAEHQAWLEQFVRLYESYIEICRPRDRADLVLDPS